MARPEGAHRVRVGYVDTDAARVVHHSTYLRYHEAARIEFLRENGFDYGRWEAETHTGLPVVEVQMRYLRPARFDDVLTVTTRVESHRSAWVWFAHDVLRGEERIHHARVRCAAVTFDGAVRRLPEALLRAALGDEYAP